MTYLTIDQVLLAHAQFGQLDQDMTKKAMGPNWPARWDSIPENEGIFQRTACPLPSTTCGGARE